MENYFDIYDVVYVPGKKVIGTIVDKNYSANKILGDNIYDDYFTFTIDVDLAKTIKTFKDNRLDSTVHVNSYESIKLLESKYIYSKITKRTMKLFHNLLKVKDVKEGAIVKIVDNYFMERIIKLENPDKLYHSVSLTNILSFRSITISKKPLKKLVNSDGYYVQCRFVTNIDSIFIYPVHIENLVLVKKQTRRKRIKVFFRKMFFWLS